jgi:DNA polymerase-3 subunit alpha
MVFLTLEDLDGQMEVTVFSKLYKSVAPLLVPDAAVVVVGRANVTDAGVKILADEVIPIAEARERLVRAVHLRLLTPGLERETLVEAARLLKEHRGACPVFLHLVIPEHSETTLQTGPGFQVRPGAELVRGLEELLGKDAVTLR